MPLRTNDWQALNERLTGVGFSKRQIAAMTFGGDVLTRKVLNREPLEEDQKRAIHRYETRYRRLVKGEGKPLQPHEESRLIPFDQGQWIDVTLSSGKHVSTWVRIPRTTRGRFAEEFGEAIAEALSNVTERYEEMGEPATVTMRRGEPAKARIVAL